MDFHLSAYGHQDNAPFLCIEPWYGIADEVNPAKDFKDKRNSIFTSE